MDLITKNRFYFWSIIVLVILNILVLATFWAQRLVPRPNHCPPGGKPPSGGHFIMDELGLTPEQASKFQELREVYFKETGSVSNEIRELRKLILDELLASEPDTARVTQLIEGIGENEIKRERLYFDHFLKLKSICRPDQRERFESFMNELMRMIEPPGLHGPRGDRPPPPKGQP